MLQNNTCMAHKILHMFLLLWYALKKPQIDLKYIPAYSPVHGQYENVVLCLNSNFFFELWVLLYDTIEMKLIVIVF